MHGIITHWPDIFVCIFTSSFPYLIHSSKNGNLGCDVKLLINKMTSWTNNKAMTNLYSCAHNLTLPHSRACTDPWRESPQSSDPLDEMDFLWCHLMHFHSSTFLTTDVTLRYHQERQQLTITPFKKYNVWPCWLTVTPVSGVSHSLYSDFL
jgi:hypothetical protein